MAGTLHPLSWNVGPAAPFGGFGIGAATPSASPVAYLLQQLQFVPQQLQQMQQAEYVQQQQLQQVLQALQSVPQQVQQILQVIQFLPQHVAQLVQQALTSSSTGIPPGVGIGAASPFSGLSTGTPLLSPVFGNPFQSMQPLTSTQFSTGQPGYVM
jgi:hypothetical protein